MEPEVGAEARDLHHLGLDRHLRELFKDHPQYQRTLEFCARYDAAAFDPEGETLPLAFFQPMLRRVFAQPRQSLYKATRQPEAN